MCWHSAARLALDDTSVISFADRQSLTSMRKWERDSALVRRRRSRRVWFVKILSSDIWPNRNQASDFLTEPLATAATKPHWT